MTFNIPMVIQRKKTCNTIINISQMTFKITKINTGMVSCKVP